MNRMQWTTLGVAVALSTLLAACGGGSSDASSAASTASSTTSTSSTSNTTTSATSTATNVTASGIVTAFGSVIVNGTEYAVDGSTTVVNGDLDDASSSYSALKVGMTVEVMTASSGYASLVRYTSAVSGEVDAIEHDAARGDSSTGRKQPQNRRDGGGLPRTRFADDRHGLPLAHREIHVPHHRSVATEPDFEACDAQQRRFDCGHVRRFSSSLRSASSPARVMCARPATPGPGRPARRRPLS